MLNVQAGPRICLGQSLAYMQLQVRKELGQVDEPLTLLQALLDNRV